MTKPLSNDIRERLVSAVDRGLSRRSAATGALQTAAQMAVTTALCTFLFKPIAAVALSKAPRCEIDICLLPNWRGAASILLQARGLQPAQAVCVDQALPGKELLV